MMTQERPSAVVHWPVVRVREGHALEGTLLSGDWVRLVTHFYRSTFLCPEVEKCDACALLSARPYWYLPILVHQTQRPSILELSNHASADLEQRCRFVGSSIRPGVQVGLARRSKKAPVRIEVLGQADSSPVAKLHEWGTALMALYHLPQMRPSESIEEYGSRVSKTVLERANLAAVRVRAAAEGRILAR